MKYVVSREITSLKNGVILRNQNKINLCVENYCLLSFSKIVNLNFRADEIHDQSLTEGKRFRAFF